MTLEVNMHPRAAGALLLLAGWAGGTQAQLPRARPEQVGMSSERLARIPQALRAAVEQGRIAGIVTLVARGGRIVALDSAGYADVAGGKPMRPSTIVRIASMTKPITSVAAMILVEEGKLRLADPIERFLPEFAEPRVLVGGKVNPDSTVPVDGYITVHDLLTHRSGIVYGFMDDTRLGDAYRKAGVLDGAQFDRYPTMAENVKRLAAQPLAFQPGSEWRYGLSTDVLGVVVEAASGMPMAQFLEQRIFQPLKMKDTGFRVPDQKLARVALTYTRQDDSLVVMPDTFSDGHFPVGRFHGPSNRGSDTYFSGGAGLFTTVGDYARFAQMLLNGGVLDGVRILSPKTVELMTADVVGDQFEDPVNGFGLGFYVVRNIGASTELGSPGLYGGGGVLGTKFWVDPRERLIGMMMVQSYPIGGRVAATFQNLAYQAIVITGPGPYAASAR
jgi:CubicO group peptidase (beta-lactamase class C family)